MKASESVHGDPALLEAFSFDWRWIGFLYRLRWLEAICGSTAALWQAGRKGRKKTQARMVMLQFPLARFALCCLQKSPLAEGETTVAWRLAEHLRRDDLVLIDRGFFSYGLFAASRRRRGFFGDSV